MTILDSVVFPRGGSGNKNLALVSRKMFKKSDNFFIPKDHYYEIIVFGAGGSGGAAMNAPNGKATGGGGPGMIRDWGVVSSDVSLAITIGAGGLRATTTSGTPSMNGNRGGTTSVLGTGITLISTGGDGGEAVRTSAPQLSGGEGGGASGGKINVHGSRGGDIAPFGTKIKATGGGSVNMFGPVGQNVCRGGDISVAYDKDIATGGGGTGGKGGDNPSNNRSFGGGAGGDAVSDVSFGPSILGDSLVPGAAVITNFILDILMEYPGLNPTAAGGNTSANVLNPGAGGGGMIDVNSTKATFGATGGAILSDLVSAKAVLSGDVDLGGGSGGCVNHYGTEMATSGKGGDGLVIISVYRVKD